MIRIDLPFRTKKSSVYSPDPAQKIRVTPDSKISLLFHGRTGTIACSRTRTLPTASIPKAFHDFLLEFAFCDMEFEDLLGWKHLEKLLLVLAADRFSLAGHFFELREELAGLGIGEVVNSAFTAYRFKAFA